MHRLKDMPSASAPPPPLPAIRRDESLYGTGKRNRARAKRDFLIGDFPADEPVDVNLAEDFTFEELTRDYRSSSSRNRNDYDDEDDRLKPFPFDSLPSDVKDEFWESFVRLAEKRSVIRSPNSEIMESIDESGEHMNHVHTPEIPQEAIENALMGSVKCYELHLPSR